MSAERLVFLACDGCERRLPPDAAAETVKDARREARAWGWTVQRKPILRDLCDECSKPEEDT